MTDLPDSTRWQLWIVAFGFFMQSLDTTIVNTALPSMAQSLGESPLHMHMVIVSYVLTVAVMLPASGWLADKVGVRNIFFTAIVLFTLGSLFCALSGTLNELLLARALQGVFVKSEGAVLRDDAARSGRAAAWPGARRSAGGVRIVALDLFDQHSGGNYWRDRHTDVNAELHHADAAL